VKPLRNSQLTDFCTALTGIRQEQIDGAQSIVEVLKSFEHWMEVVVMPAVASSGGAPSTVMVMTDGPSDMRKFMHECTVVRDRVEFPLLFYRWINVRRAFADHFRVRPECLVQMLKRMGMVFHGHHHCGLDDARNIARIAIGLIDRGHCFQRTSCIPIPSAQELFIERENSKLLEELGNDDDIGLNRRSKQRLRRKK
jgi:inhibitor of KinA sporulation pathway (predicted exonuclease)